MSRSERIVSGYCPNCKSEDCEGMGSPVAPRATAGPALYGPFDSHSERWRAAQKGGAR